MLRFQSATTGLYPLSTVGASSKIGDVRTSIYCAVSVWSLHLSYRKVLGQDGGRSHLLAQTAVKTMRGILSCWMYQIPKVTLILLIVTHILSVEANTQSCDFSQSDCLSTNVTIVHVVRLTL